MANPPIPRDYDTYINPFRADVRISYTGVCDNR